MLYEENLSIIDKKKEEICELTDALWDNPETSFEEHFACELITKKIRRKRF